VTLDVEDPAWAVAWVVSSYVITKNVKDQWPNFGASGALVFALLTWVVLSFVLRWMRPEAGARWRFRP
jgi:hypothetical protein